MKALETLMTVLRLLPVIVAAVKALEEALPTSGAGKDKLAALREIMTSVDAGINAVWPAIETAVGVIVALMNKGADKQAGVQPAPTK